MQLNELFEAKIKKQSPKKEELGDCFVAAYRWAQDNRRHIPDVKIVHAMVTGEGSVSGQRFPHAWNEIGNDVVIDTSNGRNIIKRRDEYYKLGHVNDKNPGEYRAYTFDQARSIAFNQERPNYGPWELDDDLAG